MCKMFYLRKGARHDAPAVNSKTASPIYFTLLLLPARKTLFIGFTVNNKNNFDSGPDIIY